MIIVPFNVSATNLNLADSTPYTIHSLNRTDSNIIMVPKMLKLRKETGAAYSLSNIWDESLDSKLIERRQDTVDNMTSLYHGGAFVVVEQITNKNVSRPFFWVPAEGFLDQTQEERRLVYPITNGMWLRPGQESAWRLRLTCTIASGSGALSGELFFEEVALGGL